MTLAERTAAVAAYGFTPRQAAFLTTVMLHAGVCVARQYTAFAHIVFGQNTRDFLKHLTEGRFATAHACWRGAGRIYHVHHKGLYRAIGEPDNRHRRPATLGRALERLMVLDVVLAAPELTWLGAEREKVAYFTERRALSVDDLPALVFSQGNSRTVRHFPEKLPIGLGSGDDVVFLYVVADPTGREFRAFLNSHRRLLQRLHRWTIRLAFPSGSLESRRLHTSIATDFASAPLRPAVAEEFRWFCQARRAIDDGTPSALAFDAARFAAARRAFGAPGFYAAYRAWRAAGDSVIHELLSPRLHDTWTRGDGRVEFHVLPHQYQRLASAVATA
jgi:hypothetical protein